MNDNFDKEFGGNDETEFPDVTETDSGSEYHQELRDELEGQMDDEPKRKKIPMIIKVIGGVVVLLILFAGVLFFASNQNPQQQSRQGTGAFPQAAAPSVVVEPAGTASTSTQAPVLITPPEATPPGSEPAQTVKAESQVASGTDEDIRAVGKKIDELTQTTSAILARVELIESKERQGTVSTPSRPAKAAEGRRNSRVVAKRVVAKRVEATEPAGVAAAPVKEAVPADKSITPIKLRAVIEGSEGGLAVLQSGNFLTRVRVGDQVEGTREKVVAINVQQRTVDLTGYGKLLLE